MLKLTTDKHEASHGLSATAELFVIIYMRKIHIYLVHKNVFYVLAKFGSDVWKTKTENPPVQINALRYVCFQNMTDRVIRTTPPQNWPKSADFNESLKHLELLKSVSASGNEFHTGYILWQYMLYPAPVLQVGKYSL